MVDQHNPIIPHARSGKERSTVAAAPVTESAGSKEASTPGARSGGRG
jgi:hypothetical protein